MILPHPVSTTGKPGGREGQMERGGLFPMRLVIILGVACAAMTGLFHPAWAGGRIQICLEQHTLDNSFIQDTPARGPVLVPAGTALNYAGHAFGPASDPLDRAHAPPDGDGWRDISAAEETRRRQLQMEDIGGDTSYHRPQAALMTTHAVTLSHAHPCAMVGATALLSDDWTWTMDTIPARPDMYFQAYGTVHDDQLDPTFNNDADPFQWTAAHGALNAIVTQTIDQALTLRSPD